MPKLGIQKSEDHKKYYLVGLCSNTIGIGSDCYSWSYESTMTPIDRCNFCTAPFPITRLYPIQQTSNSHFVPFCENCLKHKSSLWRDQWHEFSKHTWRDHLNEK